MRENNNLHFHGFLFAVGVSFFVAISAIILPASAIPAQSEGNGPAMFGVKEIVIRTPRFGDPKIARNCGLTPDDVLDTVRKSLQQNGIPATVESEAPPANVGLARIYLVPEVYSYNSQTLDCVSWISLWAESRNRLRIPPVDLFRTVTIVYWHQGILLEGGQSNHAGQVADGMKKLGGLFSDQFKNDQPPTPGYQ